MNDRAEREERDDEETPRDRERAGEGGITRKRRLAKKGKKRRLPRGASTRSRKRSRSFARSTRRPHEQSPSANPPSIIPQPSLDSIDEEPSEMEQRPEQEPPPPTASAPEGRTPGGDADDLFEYFF